MPGCAWTLGWSQTDQHGPVWPHCQHCADPGVEVNTISTLCFLWRSRRSFCNPRSSLGEVAGSHYEWSHLSCKSHSSHHPGFLEATRKWMWMCWGGGIKYCLGCPQLCCQLIYIKSCESSAQITTQGADWPVSKKRFLMHLVEDSTDADRSVAKGDWIICILDLVCIASWAGGPLYFCAHYKENPSWVSHEEYNAQIDLCNNLVC